MNIYLKFTPSIKGSRIATVSLSDNTFKRVTTNQRIFHIIILLFEVKTITFIYKYNIQWQSTRITKNHNAEQIFQFLSIYFFLKHNMLEIHQKHKLKKTKIY
jgi:hypothetical protein